MSRSEPRDRDFESDVQSVTPVDWSWVFRLVEGVGDVHTSSLSSCALVLINTPLPEQRLCRLWSLTDFHILADGAANRLHRMCPNLVPDVVVGDFDSAEPDVLHAYKLKGARIRHITEQDSTDLGKALAVASDAGCTKVVVAGQFAGVDGRLDHTFGIVTTMCEYSNMEILVVAGDCYMTLLQSGEHTLLVPFADSHPYCGVVPIGEPCSAISTTGLVWNMEDARMEFGGLVSACNRLDPKAGGVVRVRISSPVVWCCTLPTRTPALVRGAFTYVGIDFDGTLAPDTCSAIFHCALEGAEDRARAQVAWESLLHSYESAVATEVPEMLPHTSLPDFEQGRFTEWLEEMTAFDARENARLEESGVLSGATGSSLRRGGEKVVLAQGALQVLLPLMARGVAEVVSASWSSELLEASLALAMVGRGVRPPNVCANRLLPQRSKGCTQDEAVSSGSVAWRIRTASDKARVVADRRALLGPPVAYIGDSVNDLGALVEADVGIVLGTNSRLRNAIDRFGIHCKFIKDLEDPAGTCGNAEVCPRKVLYFADSWEEVGLALLGSGYELDAK